MKKNPYVKPDVEIIDIKISEEIMGDIPSWEIEDGDEDIG